MNAKDQAWFWTIEKTFWQKPTLLVTDVKADHGNSGGAMMNARGELSAILFAAVNLTDQYTGSSVIGVRASDLKARCAAGFGS